MTSEVHQSLALGDEGTFYRQWPLIKVSMEEQELSGESENWGN